jgi:hypothetical protein
MPRFRQIFVADANTDGGGGRSGLELDRVAFVLRKRAEREAGVYFPSLSARTLVYKGMLTTGQLEPFFPDLSDRSFASAIGLVHSRFSTNTFPSWPLAHPYRYIAHNGEINTVKGNRNWMTARESQLATDLIPANRNGQGLDRIFPICTPDHSDTASFDEVLELLHLGGRSLPHSVLMMIPEAWENHTTMDPARRAFYQFHTNLMEPWDGPACVNAARARAHRARPRLGDPPSADLRLHRGRAPGHPRTDGQDRRRTARPDGHRLAHRRALRQAPAALRLLHPAVRAGHQPAAGHHPGGAGHFAVQQPRPRGQPAARRGRLLPPIEGQRRPSIWTRGCVVDCTSASGRRLLASAAGAPCSGRVVRGLRWLLAWGPEGATDPSSVLRRCSMHYRKKRLREAVQVRAEVLGTWLATPRGRTFRWVIGTALTLVSIGAGHPWG